MVLKSCRNRSRALVFWLGIASLIRLSDLHADIIDDVNQLEPKQPKKPSSPVPSSLPPPPPSVSMPDAAEPLLIPPTEAKVNHNQDKSKVKKAAENRRQDTPIHLLSEGTSTYSRNGSVAHLQKNVVITQDDLRLQSDDATILMQKFKQAGSKDKNNVEAVELNGRVFVARNASDPSERMKARSDKAIFNNKTQIVTLDGNARLWRDGHLVKGERIVYNIITGIVQVERAQGVVQPEKTGK